MNEKRDKQGVLRMQWLWLEKSKFDGWSEIPMRIGVSIRGMCPLFVCNWPKTVNTAPSI
jgi:hypothetical protein